MFLRFTAVGLKRFEDVFLFTAGSARRRCFLISRLCAKCIHFLVIGNDGEESLITKNNLTTTAMSDVFASLQEDFVAGHEAKTRPKT